MRWKCEQMIDFGGSKEYYFSKVDQQNVDTCELTREGALEIKSTDAQIKYEAGKSYDVSLAEVV